MQNWKECYINELLSNGKGFIIAEINRVTKEFNSVDKRTRNGKNVAIFASTSYYVAHDALNIIINGIDALKVEKPGAYNYDKIEIPKGA